MNSDKCIVNGRNIFLGKDLVKQVVINSCMTVCVALAIWLQLKNGRFDFFRRCIHGSCSNRCRICGTAYRKHVGCICYSNRPGCGPFHGTAIVYIVGRLPIIICTIGMTLLYESLTYLLFGGQGIRGFYSTPALSQMGRMPLVLLPAVLAMILFVVYTYFTASGRRGKILANNQSAGVNIGINENKNVFVSYIFSGLIIGLAAIVYISQNDVTPQSGLATSSIMFSYIVPVFMGTFIGLASNDVIGIAIAAIGMEILNYGLNCLNLGAGGWQQIIMGIFVLGFYTFSSQSGRIAAFFEKTKSSKSIKKGNEILLQMEMRTE